MTGFWFGFLVGFATCGVAVVVAGVLAVVTVTAIDLKNPYRALEESEGQ